MYKNSVQRLNEIVKILAFYGFGYIVDSTLNKEQNSPKNLRKALEELGPTFIKFGQILSTRPDILSSPYIDELSKLQDRVPPENFDDINKIFFNEFNSSIDDTFASFDKTPIACASVAQVHSAILKNGKQVIVKIQRPEIEEKMRMDISILNKIFSLTKAKFSDFLIDPMEALNELLLSTEKELNFKNEEANLVKFKELNGKVAFIYCPNLISNLCSSKVLTMEKIEGFKITNMKKLLEGGYDLEDLSRKFTLSFFKQVFTDGFFHGDPHPGNVLIKEGKICFIDFGIMGNLSKSLRSALNDAVSAIAFKDTDKLVSVLLAIGIKKGYINRSKLYEDVNYLLESYISASLQNIKISVALQEVIECAKRNNIALPKDFTMLMRSILIVEGVVAKINPDMKVMDIAVSFVKSNNKFLFFNELNSDELILRTYNFIKDSSKIPTKFIELSDAVLNGRAKVKFELTSLDKSIGELNKMTNRLVFALIVSSMIMGSSMILNSNAGPKIYDTSILGIFGFGIAAFLGFWLLISILRSGKM